MDKVALVTGANRGMGFEIVKNLCKQFDGKVILSARCESNGLDAVSKLKEQGLQADYLHLDVTSKDSIKLAKSTIKTKYGGLDILFNNAGIAFKVASTVPFFEQAKVTLNTNYFGTLAVCSELFPLLRPGARVVTMASRAGQLSQVSEDLQTRFLKEDLSVDELSNIMQEFIDATKENKHREKGFSGSAYGMSVVGLIALTRIQGREMKKDSRENILVNCVCPGWVRTDMGGPNAPVSPEEGVDTPVYATLIPGGQTSPNGELIKDRRVVDWLYPEGIK